MLFCKSIKAGKSLIVPLIGIEHYNSREDMQIK